MKKRIVSLFVVFTLVLFVVMQSAFLVSASTTKSATSGVGDDNISWTIDSNGKLTLIGTGKMEDHMPAGAGWGSWVNKNIAVPTSWKIDDNDIKSIRVSAGVTDIGNAAFAWCENVKTAEMENGVCTIGKWAFLENRSLSSVTIPSSVTAIGMMAFYNCGELADVYYGGTEAQWKQISIGDSNEPLINANIHFKAETEPSVPDDGFSSLGDSNGDGKVNVKDATQIQKGVAGIITLSEEAARCADVDGNGKVNVKDATAIQKWVAGIETGFLIGEEKTA